MGTDTRRLFSVASDQYAAARPRYPAPLFDYLSASVPDRVRAWDCGTGSGQAALTLAERFGSVEATDVSREQIAHAAGHERVRYSVQPAEETAFRDGSFSLVTVAQALHWFDFERFWPEVQRVLKPGGVFAAWAYTWPHISREADRIVAAGLLDAIEDDWAPQNRLAWDGYANVPFPFRELETPRFALSLQWNLDQFLSYVGTWSATRRYIERNGDGLLANLSEELETEWGERASTRTVSMDFYCRAGRHEP